MTRSDRLRLVAVGLLSVIAFGLGVTYIDAQSMWRDEVDAIRFAQAPLLELTTNFTRPGWNGPLYFLLLRGWMRLSGSGAYSVRYFSLLFGVLCIPLTWAVGRRLLGRDVALIGAGLVACSPYLAWYSLEAKMYTWVTMLALLSTYALRRGFERPCWPWWAVQVVATSLAVYSHIIAALLIPVQAAMYVLWGPRTRRQWTAGLASGALLLLPYFPLLAWQAPLLLVRRETGFSATPLGQMLATLVTAWSLGPYPPQQWLNALPKAFAALAVWGVAVAGLRSKVSPAASADGTPPWTGAWNRGVAFSLVAWAVLPAIALGVISLWQPIFTDRYLIWCASAFYLLVALGLESLGRAPSLGRLLLPPLTLLLLLTNVLSAQAQLGSTHKADFRAVASFIAGYERTGLRAACEANEGDLADEDIRAHSSLPVRTFLPLVAAGSGRIAVSSRSLVLFQIPYARHAFEYYYEGPPYTGADGPFTNHRTSDGAYLMSELELAELMEQPTSGYDVIWLIATEVDAWDERRLTERWLTHNLRLDLVAHFAHIDVYRFSGANRR